jgi:hypothetical protein
MRLHGREDHQHSGNLPDDWDGDDLYDPAYGPPPPLTRRPLPGEWAEPVIDLPTAMTRQQEKRWLEQRYEALRAEAREKGVRRRKAERRAALLAAIAKKPQRRHQRDAPSRPAPRLPETVVAGVLAAITHHGPLTTAVSPGSRGA